MSTDQFVPHPFESIPDEAEKHPSRINLFAVGRARSREEVNPKRPPFGIVTRLLASEDVKRRTLGVEKNLVTVGGDTVFGRIINRAMYGIAAVSIVGAAGFALGEGADRLNNSNEKDPTPQMPYDGVDLMKDGMHPLHSEPSKATIPVSGEEHA